MVFGLIRYSGGIWITVMLGFIRGTSGPNDFGDNPLENRVEPGPIKNLL